MRKPDLFIVGAQRCGTTSLYNYLKEHPQIFLTEPKEPHHFSTDLYEESIHFAKKKGKSIRKVKQYFKYKDKESYLSLFVNCKREKVAGEASADYLFSREAAGNIYQFNPQAMIIIMLREPLEQIFSWHLHLKRHFSCFQENFIETLTKEEKRKKGALAYPTCLRRPSALHYFDLVDFTGQIQRYLTYFSTQQIKVVIFKNFKNNPTRIYSSLISFLGLEEFEPNEFNKYNTYKSVKSHQLKNILSSGFIYTITRPLKKIFPGSTKSLRDTFYDMFVYDDSVRKPSLDIKEKEKVKRQLKPKVHKLNDLLQEYDLLLENRDLITYWGYDKI